MPRVDLVGELTGGDAPREERREVALDGCVTRGMLLISASTFPRFLSYQRQSRSAAFQSVQGSLNRFGPGEPGGQLTQELRAH